MRLQARYLLVAATSLSLAAAQEPDQSPPEVTFGTTVVVPGGLHGTIYFVPRDTTVLPDFKSDDIERVGEIWTDSLNVLPRHWRSGFPGLTKRFEWFALDYDGRFWIDQPGRYTFALISDDGSRLFLDDTPVIDNDCQHPTDLRVAAVNLEGGVHRIRISYFQGPRDCLALVLAIAGPDRHWKLFSTREFKPPSNPEDWRYPAANTTTIVPTTPDEASLSMNQIFQQISDPEGSGKPTFKLEMSKSCLTPSVRICSR
jgi:hypothetical protein